MQDRINLRKRKANLGRGSSCLRREEKRKGERMCAMYGTNKEVGEYGKKRYTKELTKCIKCRGLHPLTL